MKLQEIMTTPVQSIGGQETIQSAAARMREARVGMLPVFQGDTCVGVVTDRDLVVRALSKGTADCRVNEVMTSNPVCLDQSADVDEAMRVMERRKIGRVVVTDNAGKSVGVVSAGAIAIACRGRAEVGQLASDLSAAHSKGA